MFFKAAQSLTPVSAGGPVSIVGELIATTIDSQIFVSDITTGALIHQFEGDGESVSALKISPSKELLCVASRSLQIHVFSLVDAQLVKTFAKAHESAIMALEVDATSTLLASGGVEGAVKVWDLRNLILTHNLKGHGSIVSSLAFYGELGSTNWKLASGSDNGKIIVWNLVKSQPMKTLSNHTSAVTSLQWTTKGDALISGGRDKVLSIWRDLELAATIPILEEVQTVGTVQGRYLFAATLQHVKILSLSTEVVYEWELGSNESEIVNVIRSNDNNAQLYACLSDDTIIELEVSEDGTVSVLRTLTTNNGEIIDLLINSAGVAALATNSKDIRLVDLKSNLMEFKPLVGHEDIVISIDLLADRWLLSGGKDKEARLWDVKTGECKVQFSGHTGAIGAVGLSRGGQIPQFVLTGSQDLTIKKWGADGNAEYTRKAHDKDINTIDVAPTNNHFASGSQDRTIKVWNIGTGEVVGVLRGHKRGVWSVKFAPGNTLVSGSGDKTVRMWSLADYSCIRTFEGHLNSVLKVSVFSPQFVASAGGDGLIKVWDTKTSESVATLDGHEDKVWSLTTTKNSTTGKNELVSGGGDGVLTVWQDHTVEEQQKQDQEEEEMVEKQQELENSVRSNEWERAIKLALELNRPLRLLKLFNDIADTNEENSISGVVAVDGVLQNLEGKPFRTLMERVRDWNTNGRTCIIAQTVLKVVLSGPDVQSKLKSNDMRKIVQALVPYTQRHLNRTNEMLESSYTLDYTIKQMTM